MSPFGARASKWLRLGPISVICILVQVVSLICNRVAFAPNAWPQNHLGHEARVWPTDMSSVGTLCAASASRSTILAHLSAYRRASRNMSQPQGSQSGIKSIGRKRSSGATRYSESSQRLTFTASDLAMVFTEQSTDSRKLREHGDHRAPPRFAQEYLSLQRRRDVIKTAPLTAPQSRACHQPLSTKDCSSTTRITNSRRSLWSDRAHESDGPCVDEARRQS